MPTMRIMHLVFGWWSAQGLATNGKLARMHANAEVFQPDAEEVYKYLQVFSACCVSFAHGANDVSNAVGPFAGIW